VRGRPGRDHVRIRELPLAQERQGHSAYLAAETIEVCVITHPNGKQDGPDREREKEDDNERPDGGAENPALGSGCFT